MNFLTKPNQVLSSTFYKDMEKRGCNKSLQTYNSLILGLGSMNQISEIYGLPDDMKEKGITLNVCTYNNVIICLYEIGRIKYVTSLLDEMLQMGISPNISSSRLLIKAMFGSWKFVGENTMENKITRIESGFNHQKEKKIRWK